LYDYNSRGGRAHKVSFDRPYAAWSGAGDFFDGDYNLIRFLEQSGYNVTYVTSLDTETTPGLYAGRRVFVSNYHDEYWSARMRAHLTAARDAGTHLAWLGANNVYWQVRWEQSSSGTANRVMVCYKDAALDPLSATQPALATVRFRDVPVNQPENALLGVMWTGDAPFGTRYPWVVRNAAHWVYAGTGLRNGDQIPALVGYEWDRVFDNGRTPGGLWLLSDSPVQNYGVPDKGQAVIYTAPSGAMVLPLMVKRETRAVLGPL
jgi:hypothetical protein